MNSALLIIDMQNAFCHSEGSLAQRGIFVLNLPFVIDNIKQLIQWAKKNKIQVIYTMQGYDNQYSNGGILVNTILPIIKKNNYLIQGTWDYQLIDEFKPGNDDIVIAKSTYDAFSNPLLMDKLAAHKIDRLYFTGVMSDICVESTLRSAVTNNFNSTLVANASSSTTELRHNLLCERIRSNFGNVKSTLELIENE